MRKALPVIIVIVIILVVGGVYLGTRKNSTHSTSATNSGTQSQSSTKPSTDNTPSSSPTATSSVTISNFAFSPASISVKKGTTVTWTNKDAVAHTVTETDGQDGPKSDSLGQGQTYSFTYNTVGTFKYHCSIHPNMTGTVTVIE